MIKLNFLYLVTLFETVVTSLVIILARLGTTAFYTVKQQMHF